LTVVAENVQFLGGPQRGAVARDGGEPAGNGGSKPAGGATSAPPAGATDDDNLPF
jgi:single-stranded DNA-binding protein